MLLHIVARGRIGRSPEAELVDRYLKRVTLPTRVTELPDTGGKMPPVEPGTRIVMLDEKGENIPSRVFAERLQAWREDGVRETRFLIGAADGFDDDARAQADLLISYGRATWPHMMARAMLAEQLWRATSILANHPYHREG
jgi:23S rRNA (pseudouridine1915-N3)-methyltransferase